MGRCGRRARAGLRRAVAQLADARRRPRRPDRGGRATPSRRPGLAPDHRERLERRRDSADGARSLPRVLPVPRVGRRTPQLPDLPAQRRRLPRRPVQHRELRAPDAHARAAEPTSSPATSSGRVATATSTTTTESRSRRCSHANPFPYPSLRLHRRPASIFDYAFEDFEVVGYEHHPAIRAPVAV